MEKKSKLDASYPRIGQAVQMKNVNSVILRYCSIRELSVLNATNKVLYNFLSISPRWKQEVECLFQTIHEGSKQAHKFLTEQVPETKGLLPGYFCSICKGHRDFFACGRASEPCSACRQEETDGLLLSRISEWRQWALYFECKNRDQTTVEQEKKYQIDRFRNKNGLDLIHNPLAVLQHLSDQVCYDFKQDILCMNSVLAGRLT